MAPGRSLDAEILVVTGGVTADDQAWLRRLGVQEIILKSAGIDTVLEAIGKALARHRAKA
jgi:DNA-binding NarL/FixJ family response regulator